MISLYESKLDLIFSSTWRFNYHIGPRIMWILPAVRLKIVGLVER